MKLGAVAKGYNGASPQTLKHAHECVISGHFLNLVFCLKSPPTPRDGWEHRIGGGEEAAQT